MPCKHYKDALIEAAASGAEPQGELHAHLDACLDCRAAFEQEQSLFASIDASLHVTANAAVPPSLLPRVRARLDEAAAPGRSWAIQWFALASATVVIVVLFAARTVWRTNVVHKPIETAEKTAVPPGVTPPQQNRNTVAVPRVEKNSVPQPLGPAKNSRSHETLVSGKITPEVLVVRDQEALLAEYAEQWRLRERAPVVAGNFRPTNLSPLQVAPIQIADLNRSGGT